MIGGERVHRLRRALFALASMVLLVLMPLQTAGAQSGPTPGDPATGDPAAGAPVTARSDDIGPVPDLDDRQLSAADAAAEEAVEELEESPASTQVVCTDEGGPEVCVRRRSTDAPAVQADPVDPSASGALASGVLMSGAVATQNLSHLSQVCDGTGSDGFRVQVVYAHTSASPDSAQVAKISAALANVDTAFTNSAARTGGQRRVRWATDDGSTGCQVTVRTARITTGAADFDSLLTDLENQGAVPTVGVGTTKHLIFSEGQMVNPSGNTCGVGESFFDDRPFDASPANRNLAGTRAAMDQRCWDINSGGSVPAHELMHTLGAVQPTAPHAGNSGHCNDEYDLMCYGPGMTYPCSGTSNDALFDCGNDDYFNTDPLAGQYLCGHWNTSDSRYLEGWSAAQPPRAVRGLSATAWGGVITVSHSGTASCYGADSYRVEVAGVGTVDSVGTVTKMRAPVGNYTVTVRPRSPYGSVFGTAASVSVTVGNDRPVGAMALSLTDGRGYGLLAWAVDPETGGPVRMRVVIPGVVNGEMNWNYVWADMPRFTGVNRTEALVFLAQLPPGSHDVCFDALDPQGGGWVRLECRNHVVK